MKRPVIFSSSPGRQLASGDDMPSVRPHEPQAPRAAAIDGRGRQLGGGDGGDGGQAGDRSAGGERRKPSHSMQRAGLAAGGVLLGFAAILLFDAARPSGMPVTQEQIDAAVQYSLEQLPVPPPATALAYHAIAPSVVRVRRLHAFSSGMPNGDDEVGVGTGVVIVDSGLILTNLHVVAGAERVAVVFADGFETDATVVSRQPDNDLAVLQALVVPEALVAATLASSATLRPGDPVVAVGFPFGLGPSLSSGVVSGLGRSYFSPQSGQLLTGLIQFDAAANPGNSGGPLVDMHGEVVGIVTGILNPSDQAVFIGIGFAVPIDTAAAAAGPSPF